MNIYRLSQSINHGQYDRDYYNQVIVVARNENDARLMRPVRYGSEEFAKTRNLDAEKPDRADIDAFTQKCNWVSNPKDVNVEYLGPIENDDSQYAEPRILMAHLCILPRFRRGMR